MGWYEGRLPTPNPEIACLKQVRVEQGALEQEAGTLDFLEDLLYFFVFFYPDMASPVQQQIFVL